VPQRDGAPGRADGSKADAVVLRGAAPAVDRGEDVAGEVGPSRRKRQLRPPPVIGWLSSSRRMRLCVLWQKIDHGYAKINGRSFRAQQRYGNVSASALPGRNVFLWDCKQDFFFYTTVNKI
jgi:hypothetical protein